MTAKKLFFNFLLYCVLTILTDCRPDKPHQAVPKDARQLKESMTRANKLLIALENEKINAFIERYGWKMKSSGTGLRYFIYKTTTGLKPVIGDSVVIQYSTMLLNGEQLYSSKSNGPLAFETGKGKTINGLEEGIFLMHVGERAKFIIPSHLAFGLLGDQAKIPQRATLVYDVELTSVKKRQ